MSEKSVITYGVPLHGVKIVPLIKHNDERGYFMEIFQKHWEGPIDPVQWSVVRSRKNVLRGPHIHMEHDEYIAALSGRVHIGLRDIRPDSPTRNCSCMVELSGQSPGALMFPIGMVHGWYFSEETVHRQAVSESYLEYHPHDNHGCHWTDPELDIPWPCSDPIIADRAATFPPLSELIQKIFSENSR
jgi:dTDP-4-dehydrorhamnose 3,5-epimerase